MRAAAGASRPLGTLDIAALIDGRTLSAFSIGVLALVGCLVLLDGFDIQAIGFRGAGTAAVAGASSPPPRDLFFSAALLGMLAGPMIASVLADGVGRQPVLLGTTFFFALCVLATAATRSVSEMVALRFLTGVGIGRVISNAVTLASEYSPAAPLSSLLLIISCGFTVGAILGGLLAAVFIPRAGWRSVFVVGGLLPLGLAVLLLRELPESLPWLLGRGANRVRIQQWLMRLAPRLTIDSATVLVRPGSRCRKRLGIRLVPRGPGSPIPAALGGQLRQFAEPFLSLELAAPAGEPDGPQRFARSVDWKQFAGRGDRGRLHPRSPHQPVRILSRVFGAGVS